MSEYQGTGGEWPGSQPYSPVDEAEALLDTAGIDALLNDAEILKDYDVANAPTAAERIERHLRRQADGTAIPIIDPDGLDSSLGGLHGCGSSEHLERYLDGKLRGIEINPVIPEEGDGGQA